MQLLSNMAISPNGKRAMVMLQSPLGPCTRGTLGRSSHVLTAVLLGIKNPLNLQVRFGLTIACSS